MGKLKLREDDATLAILDKALDAAEGVLKELIPKHRCAEIEKAFLKHVDEYLWTELLNIEKHGHRNDDPADRPPETKLYALVTVDGGVADTAHADRGVHVDILDFDNLKDAVEDPNSTFTPLSDKELEYLARHDPELCNKYLAWHKA
jgi:hypothetical protein